MPPLPVCLVKPGMKVKPEDVRAVLQASALATVGTTAAVAALGKREIDNAAAPINATSHIVWGDEAAEQDGISAKYTLIGGLLNAGAVASWAVLQQALFGRGRWTKKGGIARPLAAGAAVATLAYVTDYHIVPKRLTPGFEKRLSKGALAAMYGVLAVTLALGSLEKPRKL